MVGAESGARAVGIEYGHSVLLPFGAYDSAQNLRTSGHYAADLRSELASGEFTTTVQVLIDDKRIGPEDLGEEAVARLLADCRSTLPVDCFLLESRLIRLAESFVEKVIDPGAQRRVCKAFRRYVERSGALACSQDIALWHSLRLGLLEPGSLSSESDPAWVPRADLSPCRVAVSILPADFKQYEDMADKDLLSSNDVGRQVLRFYFPDRAPAAELDSAEWVGFKAAVWEKLKT